ncbi:MAG: AAA family ATPase [Sedimentisphaeraceae bacterium JB056]
MKIIKFSFQDNLHQWQLDPIEFKGFNLLVGVSGVGKTQILSSLRTTVDIAKGHEFNGISWSISFSTDNDKTYKWSGEFETLINEQSDGFEEDLYGLSRKPKIKKERLESSGEVIIDRRGSKITLCDNTIPILCPHQSALYLLRYEPRVSPASLAFEQVINSDTVKTVQNTYLYHIHTVTDVIKKFNTLEKIQATKFNTLVKLSLLNHCSPDFFEEIKEEFIGIFPQVEDIKIETSQQNFEDKTLITHNLLLKEKGIRGWVDQARISSGMYKTFLQLAQMHLWPRNSVIIVDEFENSLGINCIDALTDAIMSHPGDLQFIITSHHPYIINNISPDHWKVVQRRFDRVTTSDAKSLGLGKSNHEAFIQLINNDKYIDGISSQ